MKKIIIFDSKDDKIASFRGMGRMMQMLKENLFDDARFISDPSKVKYDDILLIPSWNPFFPLKINKRIAHKQYLIIFDVIPIKYSTHFPVGIRGNFNLWRNKQALQNFDKIITISQASKKDIIQYLRVPEKRIEVIYPCTSKIFINSKMLRASGLKLLEKRFVLYVGDVNWNKNLVNLARAIKLAGVKCVFVGKRFGNITRSIEHKALITNGVQLTVSERNLGDPSGEVRGETRQQAPGQTYEKISHPWQAEFQQFLNEVENDKHFIFAGYLKDIDLINLYQHAVCCVLPSYDEGFGLSYLEAATQKCPSILSDISVFREISSDSALFANPNDHLEFAEQIKILFSNQKLCGKLGNKAYCRASKLFTPLQFRRKILRVLTNN